jgi:hypothetical protein
VKKNSRLVTTVVSFLIVVACADGGDSSQPVSDQSTENDKATTQKETQGSVESENTDIKKTSSDTGCELSPPSAQATTIRKLTTVVTNLLFFFT